MAVTARRPCRMKPCDLRRVPAGDDLRLVGYYVGCPRCGWVTAAVHGDDGLVVTEHGERVSFSVPVVCTGCRVRIHLRDSDATLEETPDVRDLGPR